MKLETNSIFKGLLRTFSVFAFILICYSAKAQEKKEINGQTYLITDKGSLTDVQPYIDAMNNSDFKYHRLRNKRNTIEFKTGVKIALFSANEISKSGVGITLSEYPENIDPSAQVPIYMLGANNFIMEYYTAANHQKEQVIIK